jgi:hypothetical protein
MDVKMQADKYPFSQFMTQYGVVLFHTTSSVMQAEKLLMEKGYSIKLIPMPRQFSRDCGVALRFHWHERKQLEFLLADAEIRYDAISFLDT